MRNVLSGVAKNGMGCFVPGCFVLHSLFNYYFTIFKPVLGLLFEHTLIILFFLTLKIYQKHIIMGIIFFQLPR